MTWDDFCSMVAPTATTLTIEPYQGASGVGPVYGASTEVGPALIDDDVRVVRVSTQNASGYEQTSTTTALVPPGTVAPPLTRVTLPGGRTTRVLVVSDIDARGLPIPGHVELALE